MMSGIHWLGLACVGLLILWGFRSPVILGQRRAADRTEAINHIKQVGLALQEFDSEYGSFPNELTAAKVKAATNTPLTLSGSSSNSCFRQLLAAGLESERPFYAKRTGSRKPDDLFGNDADTLSAGECGFAYIAGLSSSMDPGTPVLMCSMIPGTTRFDASIYEGKAVILRLDNSASALPIDSAGHVILNGMDLFDPRQPFWHGKVPDLRWPE